MKDNKNFYIAVGIVAVLLTFVIFLFFQQQAKNPYQSLPNYATNECGDLQDISNIQHLSHHPQQYKDCIKLVDPQRFFEATDQNFNDFTKRNGID